MNTMDIRRAFGPMLAACVVLYGAQHFVAIWDIVTAGGEVLPLFEYSRSVSYTMWLMPLFAALPFSTSVCMDLRSGQFAQILMRVGRKRYITSKLLACGLTGGIAVSLGMMAFWGALSMVSGAAQDDGMTLEYLYITEVLKDGHVGLYIGALAYIGFIAGGFWAVSALTLSAFIPSKYYVLCFPLLLHQIALEITGIPWVPGWANIALLGKGYIAASFGEILIIATGLFGALLGICAAVFFKRMRWRIDHG